LPFEPSREQVNFLQDSGFDIEFVPYDKDHTIIEEELEMISSWMKS